MCTLRVGFCCQYHLTRRTSSLQRGSVTIFGIGPNHEHAFIFILLLLLAILKLGNGYPYSTCLALGGLTGAEQFTQGYLVCSSQPCNAQLTKWSCARILSRRYKAGRNPDTLGFAPHPTVDFLYFSSIDSEFSDKIIPVSFVSLSHATDPAVNPALTRLTRT